MKVKVEENHVGVLLTAAGKSLWCAAVFCAWLSYNQLAERSDTVIYALWSWPVFFLLFAKSDIVDLARLMVALYRGRKASAPTLRAPRPGPRAIEGKVS